jgi:hypothetical protein
MNATDKQIGFLRRLAHDREVGGTAEEALANLDARIEAGLTKRDASAMIEHALRQPRRPHAPENQAEPRPMAAEGFYIRELPPRHPEDRPRYEAYKVQWNQGRTGTYALRFTVTQPECGGHYDEDTEQWGYCPDPARCDEAPAKATWEYAPGVGRDLAADGLQPMTPAQAAQIGLSHGYCINCCKRLGGRTLSAHVSAVIGYGEQCAKTNNWPYPHGAKAQRAFLAEREAVPA